MEWEVVPAMFTGTVFSQWCKQTRVKLKKALCVFPSLKLDINS